MPSLLRLVDEPPRLDTDWGYSDSANCDEAQLMVSSEASVLQDE